MPSAVNATTAPGDSPSKASVPTYSVPSSPTTIGWWACWKSIAGPSRPAKSNDQRSTPVQSSAAIPSAVTTATYVAPSSPNTAGPRRVLLTAAGTDHTTSPGAWPGTHGAAAAA
ncbi:MAG: hypothetical protein DYG90_15435, partial [Chloroflexi bacterium CFX6]|nr:hypothetical protein [Chloroflexi bacterium CFX6]